MATPKYTSRPASDLGLRSDMTHERTVTKSAKPARNRNRTKAAKPVAVARRNKARR